MGGEMLREALTRIGAEFPLARTQPMAGHPLAAFMRSEAVDELRAALGKLQEGMACDGSVGAGNWAAVPWLAVFDPTVTTSATRGYYVVYLFSADQNAVHLSLNQGATVVYEEYKSTAREVLRDRAALMRARLPDYVGDFEVYNLELATAGRLPAGYEAGHALGRRYILSNLPDELALRGDLQRLVRAYLALTFRGGPTSTSEDAEDDGEMIGGTLTEIRRYRLHRKIERRGQASAAAKRFHGAVCQACGLALHERYGELGRGYIEAHHLKPLSSLTEGVPVTYNIEVDFAVLCANCHRMIHRTDDPSDLAGFKRLIVSPGF